MELDASHCYQAVLTHDPRFDGAFFVGVKTTGIYCRTVCTAKTPRRESCVFYPNAAAAEQAGFRPCLRCRPEVAPGNALVDSISRLAAAALSRIEDGLLTTRSVEDLAAELGISSRHLRRVLESELGVTPIELAQTQRLLLAKRLLTDTNLPVTEVAYASGFSSVGRFNTLFKSRYRMNPTDLRKANTAKIPQEVLVCEVAFRPPMDWDSTLRHLDVRASSGVEMVEAKRYLRTVAMDRYRGWIAVEPSENKHALRVEVSASLAPALLPVISRVKQLFDLMADPMQIKESLGPLASVHPGLRVPGAFDGFETAIRIILGQQISVRAATTLAGRFTAAFGEPLETPFEKLTHLPPMAARVASARPEEIVGLGMTTARARSIIALAEAAAGGEIRLEPGGNIEETMLRLKALPGIGEWTAQFIAMRVLCWPDAFPHTDLGILKALGETNSRRVLEMARAWQPWRSYAAMHLWKSLEV